MTCRAEHIQNANQIFRFGLAQSFLLNRFHIFLALLLITLGAIIRVYKLGANNLWFDEAVIWHISQGAPQDLVVLNARLNSAPFAYPFLVNLFGNLWGTSEAQLRSLSVLAGIAGMVGIIFLARRWLTWTSAIIALAIMAFAPTQVQYSRELREYSFVTLFTILVFLALEVALEAANNFRRVVLYTVVACIALFFQFGLVVVVGCAQLIYLNHVLHTQRKRDWLLFVGSSMCLASAFVIVILSSMWARIQSGNLVFPYLASHYLHEFTLFGILHHLSINTEGLLNFGFIEHGWFVFGLLFLIGIVAFPGSNPNRRRVMLYVFLPFLMVVALSFLKLYPYGGVRQDLFLLPMLYITSSVGFESLIQRLARSQISKIFLLAALLLAWIVFSFWHSVLPMYSSNFNGENLRPHLEYLAQHLAPGDSIYVYWGATPAFRYYWQDQKLGDLHRDSSVILEKGFRTDPNRYLAQVRKCIERSTRCWLVFSHNLNKKLDEQKVIIDWMRARYHQQELAPFAGASANNRYINTGVYLFAR